MPSGLANRIPFIPRSPEHGQDSARHTEALGPSPPPTFKQPSSPRRRRSSSPSLDERARRRQVEIQVFEVGSRAPAARAHWIRGLGGRDRKGERGGKRHDPLPLVPPSDPLSPSLSPAAAPSPFTRRPRARYPGSVRGRFTSSLRAPLSATLQRGRKRTRAAHHGALTRGQQVDQTLGLPPLFVLVLLSSLSLSRPPFLKLPQTPTDPPGRRGVRACSRALRARLKPPAGGTWDALWLRPPRNSKGGPPTRRRRR